MSTVPSQGVDHHEYEPVKRGRRRVAILGHGIVGCQTRKQWFVWEEARRKYEDGDRNQDVGGKQKHGA